MTPISAARRAFEPDWCLGEHVNGHTMPDHRSTVKTVGKPTNERGPGGRGRGQVSAWLESALDGPTSLAVQTSIGFSATVPLTLHEAAKLRDELTVLLVEAGYRS